MSKGLTGTLVLIGVVVLGVLIANWVSKKMAVTA